jgi:hypothetical protein
MCFGEFARKAVTFICAVYSLSFSPECSQRNSCLPFISEAFSSLQYQSTSQEGQATSAVVAPVGDLLPEMKFCSSHSRALSGIDLHDTVTCAFIYLFIYSSIYLFIYLLT